MHIPAAYFRGDIQGLRAISVALVFIYHLESSWAPGGFVGVDTFFVISGFIITSLLAREAETTGWIDYPAFLARRVRRLLPNATLVLLAVLAAAAFLSPNHIAKAVAADVRAAALYFANFHFAAIAVDYFASHRAPSPVVHFWSLSIEEQFYFFFPLMLIAILSIKTAARNFRTAATLMVAAIVLASFAYGLAIAVENQPKAFFGSLSRVWELGVGALLALSYPVLTRTMALRRVLAGPAGLAGLAMIAVAAAIPEDAVRFPGWITLLPVAGAALAILAGATAAGVSQPAVSRVLAAGPMRWLGDRSYSLYLWHWPIFVYMRNLAGESPLALLAMAAAALVVAELAFRYVEEPIRNLDPARFRKLAQIGAGMGLAACTVAGTAAAPRLQLLMNSKETVELVKWLDDAQHDNGLAYADNCHTDNPVVVQPECAYGPAESKKVAILFGDSHAAHWFPALHKAAIDDGWKVHMWSKSSCPAARIALYNPHQKANYTSCSEWRDRILKRIVSTKQPLVVILSSSNGYSGWTLAEDGVTVIAGRAAEDLYEKGLYETAKTIVDAGHKVIIMRDTPLADPGYLDCLLANGGVGCARPRDRAVNANEVEKRVAERIPGAVFVDATEDFCDDFECQVVLGDLVMYRDDSHMTAKFAETLAWRMRDALRATQP